MDKRMPSIVLIVILALLLIFFIGPLLNLDSDIWTNAIGKFAEVLAIVMGGLWTYLLFIRNRLDYPYAKIAHKVTHRVLNKEKTYLSVFVIIENAGKTAINIVSGIIYVRKVLPIDENISLLIDSAAESDLREANVENLFTDSGRQVAWPEIGYRSPEWKNEDLLIEPGESEEIQFDFIIDSNTETIEIITYFKNVLSERRGWKLTTLYDLRGDKNMPDQDQEGKRDILESQVPPSRTEPAIKSQIPPERTPPVTPPTNQPKPPSQGQQSGEGQTTSGSSQG